MCLFGHVGSVGPGAAEIVAPCRQGGRGVDRVTPVPATIHRRVTPPCQAPTMGTGAGWADGETLAFDLETTGVDRFCDVPVSFALARMVGGQVLDVRHELVDPGRPIPEAATAVHGITTERARADGMPLDSALDTIAGALVDASRRKIPVVGMKLDYDLTIIDSQLRVLTGRGLADRGFVGPVVDALVLDRHFDRYRKGTRKLADLCRHYALELVDAHDAAADAVAAGQVVDALCRRYLDLSSRPLHELHIAQAAWHRQWASSFDAWRRREGLSPLDAHEWEWPIASVDERVAAPQWVVAAG